MGTVGLTMCYKFDSRCLQMNFLYLTIFFPHCGYVVGRAIQFLLIRTTSACTLFCIRDVLHAGRSGV